MIKVKKALAFLVKKRYSNMKELRRRGSAKGEESIVFCVTRKKVKAGVGQERDRACIYVGFKVFPA